MLVLCQLKFYIASNDSDGEAVHCHLFLQARSIFLLKENSPDLSSTPLELKFEEFVPIHVSFPPPLISHHSKVRANHGKDFCGTTPTTLHKYYTDPKVTLRSFPDFLLSDLTKSFSLSLSLDVADNLQQTTIHSNTGTIFPIILYVPLQFCESRTKALVKVLSHPYLIRSNLST